MMGDKFKQGSGHHKCTVNARECTADACHWKTSLRDVTSFVGTDASRPMRHEYVTSLRHDQDVPARASDVPSDVSE